MNIVVKFAITFAFVAWVSGGIALFAPDDSRMEKLFRGLALASVVAMSASIVAWVWQQ